MVRGNVEIIELLDSDDDNAQVDENNGNEDDGDVEEVQVARAVRGAVGADDEDEDLVVTGAFETRHPKFLFFCFFFCSRSPLLSSSEGVCRCRAREPLCIREPRAILRLLEVHDAFFSRAYGTHEGALAMSCVFLLGRIGCHILMHTVVDLKFFLHPP